MLEPKPRYRYCCRFRHILKDNEPLDSSQDCLFARPLKGPRIYSESLTRRIGALRRRFGHWHPYAITNKQFEDLFPAKSK